MAFFLFALFDDEPEVFLPKNSQTAILHAAHFQRVVKLDTEIYITLVQRELTLQSIYEGPKIAN